MEGRHRRGPQRPYPRVARVNALLLEILAEEVERRADADERLRLVTLTGVVCEPGLSQAVVYVASLAPDAADGLEDHRKALQAVIGAQVRMKRTPLLSFAVDPAIVAGAAVEAALRRAKPLPSSPGDAEPE
ncbi:MAG: ribosome-binding factor [Acidimicrobiaceae bacterium]|jgi:ribosome-binding factor A|nr:ribosome-binding factor [Acidimicrobiaceae bacterium]